MISNIGVSYSTVEQGEEIINFVRKGERPYTPSLGYCINLENGCFGSADMYFKVISYEEFKQKYLPPHFEVGKWYKNLGKDKKYIAKFAKFSKEENGTLNFCSDGMHIYNGILEKSTCKDFSITSEYKHAVECPIEEIQHILPEGHIDKISKKSEIWYAECLMNYNNTFTKGKIYKLEQPYPKEGMVHVEKDDENEQNGWDISNFKPSSKEAFDAQEQKISTVIKKVEDLKYPDVVYIQTKEQYDKIKKHLTHSFDQYKESRTCYLIGGGSGNKEEYSNSTYVNYTIIDFSNIIFPEKIKESWYITHKSEFSEDLYNKLIKWCEIQIDSDKHLKWRNWKPGEPFSEFKLNKYFIFASEGDGKGFVGVDNNRQCCQQEISLNKLKEIIDYKAPLHSTSKHSLLTEADRKYPIGTKFYPAHLNPFDSNECIRLVGEYFDFENDNSENIVLKRDGEIIGNNNQWIKCVKYKETWAKIISSEINEQKEQKFSEDPKIILQEAIQRYPIGTSYFPIDHFGVKINEARLVLHAPRWVTLGTIIDAGWGYIYFHGKWAENINKNTTNNKEIYKTIKLHSYEENDEYIDASINNISSVKLNLKSEEV